VWCKKPKILLTWTEPWPYAWFKCKKDFSSLFTLKKPHGIFIALTPLFILMVIAFTVIYRIINDINVFVPAPPNLSASMTNAPLVTIFSMGFGCFIGYLILIVPLTLLCAFLERNITLYADKIGFGKRAIKYNDIHSFAITISDNCPEEMQVLTLHLKDAPELSGSPVDFGLSPEIDIAHLGQILLNKIPDKSQHDEASG
jgi:hypothetical protein